jgi:hypothetical protein
MADQPYVLGAYEREDNVLHTWHPQPITLDDPFTVERFFREVKRLIESCPERPYMLVNYAGLAISPEMMSAYQAQLKTYRPLVLGVFRYGIAEGVGGTLTGVTVRLANKAEANIFPDEAAAREAIRKLRAAERR